MKMFCDGCAGFIGQFLVKRLLDDGHEVTVFDNYSTGRREDVDPRATRIGGDITIFQSLAVAMHGHDMVWHLAANGDIPRGQKDPDFDFQVNTVGTKNVLEAMRINGIKQIAFSSTAAVYGDGAANRVPLTETHGPLLPISLYAASKLAGEAMISAYCHLFGMKAWIFRFANVVGGRMNHGLLFDTIQKFKKNPAEIDVWGSGFGEKPFVLIDDLIWGMIVAFRHCEKQCDIYNLGVSDFTTIRAAVEIVREEMGLPDAKLNFGPNIRGFPGDVPIVRFDPSKMAQYGWKAQYGSTEAVRIAVKRLLNDSAPAPLPDHPAEEPHHPESFGPH